MRLTQSGLLAMTAARGRAAASSASGMQAMRVTVNVSPDDFDAALEATPAMAKQMARATTLVTSWEARARALGGARSSTTGRGKAAGARARQAGGRLVGGKVGAREVDPRLAADQREVEAEADSDDELQRQALAEEE